MEAVRIKELFDSLYLSERELTAGQMDFINSCRKQFTRTKELSNKQLAILKDIKKCLLQGKAEQRYTMRITN